MSGQEKPTGDFFEDGLRHILSNAAASDKGGSSAQDAAEIARRRAERIKAEQAAAEKHAEAERRALFWFKLLRPAAVLALLGLMALFVSRIVNPGG